MGNVYLVKGMTCEGCVRAVRNAVSRVAPGAAIEVDLDSGRLTVSEAIDDATIARAIEEAGFEFAGAVA